MAALEAVILANRAADPGIRRSNTGGGWHSDLKLGHWGGRPAKLLIDEVIGIVNQHTMVAGGTGKETLRWRVEAWANVNQLGDTVAVHNHAGGVNMWAAIYYVDTGESAGATRSESAYRPTCHCSL